MSQDLLVADAARAGAVAAAGAAAGAGGTNSTPPG
jgi:hypothetical protein